MNTGSCLALCQRHETVMGDGSCQACDGNDQAIIKEDGTCEVCSEYQFPDEKRESCIYPTCGDGEKIISGGKCELCEEPTVVSDDGLSCVNP